MFLCEIQQNMKNVTKQVDKLKINKKYEKSNISLKAPFFYGLLYEN